MHWFLSALVVRWHNYYNCFNTLAANYILMFFFFHWPFFLNIIFFFFFFCFMLCPWWHSTIRGFDFVLRANPARSWAPLPSAECKGGLGPLRHEQYLARADSNLHLLFVLRDNLTFLVNCCGITDYWETSTFEKSCCCQTVVLFLQNKQFSDCSSTLKPRTCVCIAERFQSIA